MTVLETTSPGTATTRMTRVLFVGTSLTGLAFSATNFSHAIDQARFVDLAWDTVVATALWSVPIVLLLLSWWAPLATLRAVAVAYMGIFLLAVLTWPFAQLVPRIPDGTQPWIINLLPMAVFAGALVLPAVGAWISLAVLCLAVGALRFLADGGTSLSIPVQDTLFNAMYVSLFVAIILVTLRAGRQRDIEADRTANDTIIAAAAEAQNLERATAALLTHDEVIATLITAARSTDATAAMVTGYATRALQRLDALAATSDDPTSLVPAHALVSLLRETVGALADTVRFHAPEPAGILVPTSVLRALSDATAEAVRNSLRHAGDSERRVTAVVTDTGAIVEIVDDGAGFDSSSVTSERFGIRFSIVHRMSLVEGGSAELDSTPGKGTRIVLHWMRGPQ